MPVVVSDAVHFIQEGDLEIKTRLVIVRESLQPIQRDQ
jgi:hypothetical protein